jgi:ribonuclease E
VTKNNLEAAEEIVRQLRLRDIGGIIVIDFIDMVLESNRDLVLRRLVECLSRDRTKHQVAEVTSLGLVQMTRKRLGVGLAESLGETAAQPEAPKQDQRRRRGGGGGQQQQPAPQRQSATHAITDGAKTMLAQIAGATLANGKQLEPEKAEHVPEPVHAPEPAAAQSAPPEPEAPAVLLDLPVEHHEAAPHLPEVEAAGLLDSVLNALPAPKRPGEGRRRSRRVSTPALTPGQND